MTDLQIRTIVQEKQNGRWVNVGLVADQNLMEVVDWQDEELGVFRTANTSDARKFARLRSRAEKAEAEIKRLRGSA